MEEPDGRITLFMQNAGYRIALCKDGTVWSWGNNDGGKLGIAASAIQNPQRIKEPEDTIEIVDGSG